MLNIFQSYPYFEDISDIHRICFFDWIRCHIYHILLNWIYFRHTAHCSTFFQSYPYFEDISDTHLLCFFDWIRSHIYHILLNWIYFRHTAHCSTFFQSYPYFEDTSDTHLLCFFDWIRSHTSYVSYVSAISYPFNLTHTTKMFLWCLICCLT